MKLSDLLKVIPINERFLLVLRTPLGGATIPVKKPSDLPKTQTNNYTVCRVSGEPCVHEMKCELFIEVEETADEQTN